MQISLERPVQATPWSDSIPCVGNRVDETTGKNVYRGLCVFSGERKVACWRTDTGWFEEGFTQPPANRIKGWLELTEHLLKQAGDTRIDDTCDRVTSLRAASDGFAVIDRITKAEGVTWDRPLADLYKAIKGRVRNLSAQLENSSREPDGTLVVSKLLYSQSALIQGLSDSVQLTSTSMKRDNGNKVETLAGISIAALARVAAAVAKGVVAFFATKLGAIVLAALAIAVAIYVVVRIFDEAWKTIKGWFGG